MAETEERSLDNFFGLIGKDSDAGRDWGQEEKGMTQDETACSFPGENASSWGALGEARPGQSSLSAGALRYRAWAGLHSRLPRGVRPRLDQERTGESGAFGLWPHPRGSSRISS